VDKSVEIKKIPMGIVKILETNGIFITVGLPRD